MPVKRKTGGEDFAISYTHYGGTCVCIRFGKGPSKRCCEVVANHSTPLPSQIHTPHAGSTPLYGCIGLYSLFASVAHCLLLPLFWHTGTPPPHSISCRVGIGPLSEERARHRAPSPFLKHPHPFAGTQFVYLYPSIHLRFGCCDCYPLLN